MATWSVLCKSLLKNAVEGGKAAAPHIMTFSKMAFPYVKSGVKAVGSATKSGVKFAVEHPKSAAAMSAVALPIVGYKKGLLTFAKEKAFQMIVTGECGVFSPKLLECFRLSREEIEEII